MQLAFYYDQSRCIGCKTCVVACKDWNDVPPGLAAWRRILTLEKGVLSNLSVSFLGLNCFHCAEPACIPICPGGALHKREEDGIVVVHQELCLPNCQSCLQACPYHAPQFRSNGAPMEMCDFCLSRREAGLRPVCVEACPQRALDSAPKEVLMEKYPSAVNWVEGYPLPNLTQPSVLVKPIKPKKRR